MQERLQKILSRFGTASRRKSEEMIQQGRVSVNGQIVTELGSKADPERDIIMADGKLLRGSPRRVYLLLNKPPGYVSTRSDPQKRPTVLSLLKGVKERVYPVGRLDYNSSGILILTNDGDLANMLMSRASAVPRTYHVKLDGQPSAADLARLEQGIVLDGQSTAPATIRALIQRERPWYEITLTEGRYHQVRRMFERIGREVIKLKRVRIAFLTDDGLALGQYRNLRPAEVDRLRDWVKSGQHNAEHPRAPVTPRTHVARDRRRRM